MLESATKESKEKIFVSFSFSIKEEVMQFIRRIEKRFGEDIIWICTEGITGGDVLDGRIIKAIENAEIILCMVNTDFADSPECEREVLLSRQKNKLIIPILFEEIDWPLKKSDGTPSNMQLAFAQRLYVNMYDTAKKKEEFRRLIHTIGKELGLREQAPDHQPSVSANRTKSVTPPKSRGNKYCYECRQIIRGEWVGTSDRFWHPEHFVCAYCRDNLEDKPHMEHDNKIFCEDDYNNLFRPKCFTCRKPLIGGYVTALGRKYHPHHFLCNECNQPIDGQYFENDGQPYCRQDYDDLFTRRCSSCKCTIDPRNNWIDALDKSYHSHCFTCSICQTPLKNKNFYEKNGRPVCKIHARY